MRNEVVKGVFERYGPGKSDSTGRLLDYIDIGGRRIPNVFWDMPTGYALENSLGKEISISLYKGGPCAVAAVKSGDKVVKATWKPSTQIRFAITLATLCILLLSFPALLFSSISNLKWWFWAALTPSIVVLCVAVLQRHFFKAAKTTFD